MAAKQLSPGVLVSEIDLTTVVPAVQSTNGGFAGTFNWGPVDQITLVTSSSSLLNNFGRPDEASAVSFYTAANFLAYGNNLRIVRSVGSNSYNSQANTTGDNLIVKNKQQFQDRYLDENNENAYGAFIGRYAGDLGNSLRVEVCANTQNFSTWNYAGYFESAPDTSDYASELGGANDEMHIIVIDEDGLITGTANTVVEKFAFVSKAADANINGATNYYKQVIFNKSRYVYAIDPVDYNNSVATWGTNCANTTFYSPTSIQSSSLVSGADDAPTNAELELAWDLFANKNDIDVSLLLTGDADYELQQYIIDNIVDNPNKNEDSRRDCIVFVSPPKTAVVDAIGSETDNIETWLTNLNRSTSFAVADSGWKYQYDKYNKKYRWIPLNGDIAGLCVNTDKVRDPWFSPAGFNRGQIKNCIKLAWNPTKPERDIIYPLGVNPVCSFTGQGFVLYGDKTLLKKPSAFDRINVRRLFIVLEKAISNAAKFSLFEMNDEFTRAQFVALVTPYLRDIQGRHGIYDFRVVCDSSNNTPAVIDGNQFIGDIYIKPSRSINFIQLNFVAVGTGVDFTTIVGSV